MQKKSTRRFAFRGPAEQLECEIAEILDRDAAPGKVGSLGHGDLNNPVREGPQSQGEQQGITDIRADAAVADASLDGLHYRADELIARGLTGAFVGAGVRVRRM